MNKFRFSFSKRNLVLISLLGILVCAGMAFGLWSYLTAPLVLTFGDFRETQVTQPLTKQLHQGQRIVVRLPATREVVYKTGEREIWAFYSPEVDPAQFSLTHSSTGLAWDNLLDVIYLEDLVRLGSLSKIIHTFEQTQGHTYEFVAIKPGMTTITVPIHARSYVSYGGWGDRYSIIITVLA